VETQQWWYVYVRDTAASFSGSYTLSFVQADGSQFSADQQGVLDLYVYSFIGWLFGALVLQFGFKPGMRQKKCYSRVIQAYCRSIEFSAIGAFCKAAHWALFFSDGHGAPILFGIGDCFYVLAHLLFLAVLLMLGGGYLVLTSHLNSGVFLGVLGVCSLVIYMCAAVWMEWGEDPASYEYVYSSYPGRYLSGVHITAGTLFAMSTLSSYEKSLEAHTQTFFRQLGLFFTPYFFVVPILRLTAVHLPPHIRQWWMEMLEILAASIWMPLLGCMLRPARAHFFLPSDQPSRKDQMDGAIRSYDNL